MSPLPSPVQWIDGLRSLSPRSLRYLEHRHLERHSLAETAAHFGISEDALRIHLLRAACELAGRLDPTSARWVPGGSDREEAAVARALELAVAVAAAHEGAVTGPSRGAASGREVELLARLCRHLREAGPRLLQGIEEAERAAFNSPEGRRRERLRTAAIIALVLLTVWMSLR